MSANATGMKARSQAAQKGQKLKVGPNGTPNFLCFHIFIALPIPSQMFIIKADDDDDADIDDDEDSDDDNIRPSWATVANSIDLRPFLAESSAHIVGPIKFT